MTRKCVLCKETNYRNSYSFFSAPKDSETRKKWQTAIAIENYAVTDETYVCSKHFHKDDIITHWVSGVPPHVITIKYKKCRLRPGAVPSRHLKENSQTNPECSDDSDINMSDYLTFKPEKEDEQPEKRTFAIPRISENFRKSQNQNNKSMAAEYRFSTDVTKVKHPHKEKKPPVKIQANKEFKAQQKQESELMVDALEGSSQESTTTVHAEKETEDNTDAANEEASPEHDKMEEIHTDQENSQMTPPRNGSESPGAFNHSDMDDTSTDMWDENGKNCKVEKDMDTFYSESQPESQALSTGSYETLDQYYLYKESEEGEMLFEDLLEVCSEIMLPDGWSCAVTSKGHSTTVVYLYMGMAKNGMPYVQKQVFLQSDMLLRCTAANREINPLIHNLIRDGKHQKVHTLLDLEELIDEFDQRVVCEGVVDTDECQEINEVKVAYNDGVQWRHVSCPLILNNDSPRCTKCITLSYMILRKKNFSPFEYSQPIFSKQQKVFSAGQIRKRTRKHDRRYDFIKLLTK